MVPGYREHIDGLIDLTFVGGSFTMAFARSALDTEGLSNLETVGRLLDIEQSDGLENVNGFRNLQYIGSSLLVWGNDSLRSLSGFSKLTYVGQNLAIYGNDSLARCSGLFKLLDDEDHADPGPGVPPVPDVGGDWEFWLNSPGCNSIEEILDSEVILISGFDDL
jgi:hypothetical protein